MINPYMMLSRLQMDLDYFTGHSNGSEKHLFYDSIEEHVSEFKKLYSSLPADKKPDWLSSEAVARYEADTVGVKAVFPSAFSISYHLALLLRDAAEGSTEAMNQACELAVILGLTSATSINLAKESCDVIQWIEQRAKAFSSQNPADRFPFSYRLSPDLATLMLHLANHGHGSETLRNIHDYCVNAGVYSEHNIYAGCTADSTLARINWIEGSIQRFLNTNGA